jgi:ATP-dependent DNA helicase PIF1
LIVDEVSMLSQKIFELLNEIGKAVRKSPLPFGGLQLIFCGDFYQLPPVGNRDDQESKNFCFESMEWETTFSLENQIELIQIFRQTDQEYVDILNQIREGKIKNKTNIILSEMVGREIDKSLIIEPTKIFPIRSKVDAINRTKMDMLTGNTLSYNMEFHKNLEITKKEALLKAEFTEKDIQFELTNLSKNLMCDEKVQLKVGAQVMCIINVKSCSEDSAELELCNGSQGIITSFCDLTGFPVVKFNNGKTIMMTRHTWKSEKIPGIGVSQVPLILAWAITIHKSQGTTMDVAEIDVGQDIFENGQTYVALSRVKSLSGLYLSGYNSNKIFIHTKAREFYEKLRIRNRTTLAADSLKTTDDSSKIPSKPNSHPQENTCFLSKWKAGNLDTSKKTLDSSKTTLDSSKKTLDDSLKTINDTVKPTDDTVKTLHMSRNIRSFFGTTVKTS